jgi:hypothetical protein
LVRNLQPQIIPAFSPLAIERENRYYDVEKVRRRSTIQDSAMMKPERRKTPRKLIEKLAYVNLEPNKGGIVLNVSEGGFCFQSVVPLHQLGTIRFWLSIPGNPRIEAVGKLAWTDATRKNGGFQFTSVPAGVRQQIRNWAGLPASPLSTDEEPAAQIPVVPRSTAPTASQSEKDVASPSDSAVPQKDPSPEIRAPMPSPFRWPPRVLAVARCIEQATIPKVSAVARGLEKAISTALRAHFRPSFVRGAVTGLLFLVVVGALIQSGRLFAGKPRPRIVRPVLVHDSESNPAHESAKFAANSAPSRGSGDQMRTQIEEMNSQSKSDAEQPHAPARTRPKQSASELAASDPTPLLASMHATPPASSISPVPASTTSSLSSTTSDPNPVSAEPVSSSRFESTHRSPVGSPGSSGHLEVGSASLIYFEVGNFKDPVWADKAIETLGQSGFHAIVMHKGHLWMNSYHVLAGPFANDGAAETAKKNLESHGFKPRPDRISLSK